MVPKHRLSPFATSLSLTLVLLVCTAITFGVYVYREKQIDHANELRLQSFLLANQLRQSSDDLTRMARTYVETGDSIYKQAFQKILDIREGEAPRPVAYGEAYWDLVLSGDRRPLPTGEAVALLELMRRAGFTGEEFDKLQQAKIKSDALTRIEFAAMALVESKPATEINRAQAIEMLIDEAFHQAKADIMRPISEFNQMMELRTLNAVRAAEQAALRLRYVFIVLSLLLVFSLWRVYRALYSTLGCSVDDLQGYIARLGSGDFTASIPVPRGMEKSVLGWLSTTQTDLARIDTDRKQSEDRFRAAVEAAPNGMVIIDARGVIVALNSQFSALFGYAEHDLIGQSINLLLPEYVQEAHAAHVNDFIAYPAKRAIGAGRDLFGQHQDGRQIQVEVGLSPLQINGESHVLASVVDITARVVAEKWLKTLSADLSATLKAIPDMLFELSENGEYINLWARNPELLASQKELLLGHTVGEMLPPEAANIVMSALREANDHGYSSGQVIRLDLPVGESWFELSTAAKSTGDDARKHFVMLSRDITARKIAELKVEQLTKIYAALSQCNQAIVRCKDEAELFPILCRDAVNFGGMKMAWIGMLDEAKQRVIPVTSFGSGVEYLEGIQLTMDADDPNGRGPTGTSMREDRPVWCQDFQHDPATKAWRDRAAKFGWGASASLPLHRHGAVVGACTFYTGAINQFDTDVQNLLVEMVLDIDYAIGVYENEAQRKQLEESLQNSEDRYRKAFQTSPDAINITRLRDGMYLDVNSGFERMTGFLRDEVIGKTSVELGIWHNLADRQRLVDALSKEGLCENLEADFKAKHGGVINGLMSATVIQIKDETCVITITRDITERKQTLERLRMAATELEQANVGIEEERAQLAVRVEERTAQLQYANHAKDSFLATMSHEIRTPLGGLLGMMELLGLSDLDDKQRAMLDAAQGSGKNLLRIVNDILDWSKIEAGKLELAPRAASIAEMLKGVTKTYGQVASSKGIQLVFRVDDDLGPAHIFDALRLSQILNNFTSNAIKFTAQGSVEISAQRLIRHNGSENIRFCVKDSGVGIAQEQQARLFQHYEHASADTARMYGGTGLGLAICRRLAELMDGTLSVESTAGIGSTFCLTVTLPVADLTEQRELQMSLDKQEIDEDGVGIVAPLAQGKHLSILVVDDHPVNRMLLKQQLEQLGLQAEIAAHGMMALSLWQAGHFNLIITDCHMPEMDGYELTRSIREIEQHEIRERVPIIAWTANVLAEEELRCRAAGMDDMLTKPTDLSDLREMLLKWLDKAGSTTNAELSRVVTTVSEHPAQAVAAMDFGALKKFAISYAAQIEMLQAFSLQNRSDIADLHTALKAGDPAAVARVAHRIKGASRMVGAVELASVCTDIEAAARRGEMPDASGRLNRAMVRVEAAISEFVQRR